MTGDLVEHVLEERHTDGEARLAGAIEIDGDLDTGFRCCALRKPYVRTSTAPLIVGRKGAHYRRKRPGADMRRARWTASCRKLVVQPPRCRPCTDGKCLRPCASCSPPGAANCSAGGSDPHLRAGHAHQPAGSRAAEGTRLFEHLPRRQCRSPAPATGCAEHGGRGAGACGAPGSGPHRHGGGQRGGQDPPVHPHRLCPAQHGRAARAAPTHPRARHQHAGRHGDAGTPDRRAAGRGVRGRRHRLRSAHHALLVALFNFMQGKELAGGERALG